MRGKKRRTWSQTTGYITDRTCLLRISPRQTPTCVFYYIFIYFLSSRCHASGKAVTFLVVPRPIVASSHRRCPSSSLLLLPSPRLAQFSPLLFIRVIKLFRPCHTPPGVHIIYWNKRLRDSVPFITLSSFPSITYLFTELLFVLSWNISHYSLNPEITRLFCPFSLA